MNELLQKHGCSNVFSIPEGLKELMSDITREVLREQPAKIFDFIANYLSVLLITREHGVMAVKILDDLCDCRPSVYDNLIQIGLKQDQAQILADIIKEEIEGFEPTEGKETIKEYLIIKKILTRYPLDEVITAKLCQVIRNTYREYWYRKKTMEKSLKIQPNEPWEIAAERTLELYKRTKPSLAELHRATEKIQAAYRGYHVRRNLLSHLKPKRKKGPKFDLPGPPLDIAASREIDLGPLIDIKVREDNVNEMFDEHATMKLGLQYDPMKTITHIPDDEDSPEEEREVAHDNTSRVSASPSPFPPIEPRYSKAPSIVPSVASEGKQSRLPSVHYEEESNMKISFSEVPPEVIPDEPNLVEDVQEVKEVIEPAADVDAEETEAAEVPEDIPDDRTEGDGESAATASIPSSAPDTANTTDVEDEGGNEMTSGEEEG